MRQDAAIVIRYHTRTMKQNRMNDDYYMGLALKEAELAYMHEEVPVGCVIVYQNKVIAKAHNLRYKNKSVLDHAEIIAIKKATRKLGNWMLDDCTLYVTVEPCLMCAGTIIQSRIKKVVYGTNEPKFGAFGSITDLSKIPLNYQLEVTKGVMAEQSSQLLKAFFKKIRNKNNSSIVDKNEN